MFFKNDKFYLFTHFACADLYTRILFPKGSFSQLKKCLLPPSPWIILGPEWVCFWTRSIGIESFDYKVLDKSWLWMRLESLIAQKQMYFPLLVMQELGLIRKPASFMTSICDERGQELIYAGMPITEVFKSEIGLGGTLGLLWFQRRLASQPKLV